MNLSPLVWAEPWLAPIVMNIENIVATTGITYAGVTGDGKTLYYNPKWWAKLNDKERLGAQMHEILHIANLHGSRMGYRTHRRWNKACDVAINYKIAAAGYKLPKVCLEGEDDSAENIYDRLRDEKLQGTPSGLPGDDEPQSAPLSDDLIDAGGGQTEVPIETLESIESAGLLAGKGTTPLSKLFRPSVAKGDWRTILQKYVQSAVGSEMDYITYEFDDFGICEDLLTEKPKAKVCALVDESGSISDELYRDFLAELRKMEQSADVYASGFAGGTELHAIPLKKYRRTMTGGTLVLPAYEQACQERYDCVIVLTDGYLDFPGVEPVPTIWTMPESHGRKMEVII